MKKKFEKLNRAKTTFGKEIVDSQEKDEEMKMN